MKLRSLYTGEIGIDNAHDDADNKQQNDNLQCVIHKEVKCLSQMSSGIYATYIIYKPIGELLNHKFCLINAIK